MVDSTDKSRECPVGLSYRACHCLSVGTTEHCVPGLYPSVSMGPPAIACVHSVEVGAVEMPKQSSIVSAKWTRSLPDFLADHLFELVHGLVNLHSELRLR